METLKDYLKERGNKSERLDVLQGVFQWLQDNPECLVYNDILLGNYMNGLVNMYGNEKYFFLTETNKIPSVCLLGKTFMGTISMAEFYERVLTMYSKYGNRAHTAAEAGGVDVKALSHAVRVLFEYVHLLEHGYIKFPLPEGDRNYVLSVKKGEQDYDNVQDTLTHLFEEIENIQPCGDVMIMNYDKRSIDNLLLRLYTEAWD